MLRKVLFTAVALVLVTACSKKESTETAKSSPKVETTTTKDITKTSEKSTTKTDDKTNNTPLIYIKSYDQFKEIVMADTNRLVVVDMYADWCGPCKTLAPIFSDLAKEYNGKAIFLKVNVDKNRDIAQDFRVQSIPYVVMLKGRKIVSDVTGLNPVAKYKIEIDKNL
jgi:thioredoxin 1